MEFETILILDLASSLDCDSLAFESIQSICTENDTGLKQ